MTQLTSALLTIVFSLLVTCLITLAVLAIVAQVTYGGP